jgi:hypothetical protein
MWTDIKMLACGDCNTGPEWKSNNLRLHSTFKENEELEFPQALEQALEDTTIEWEHAKRLWLRSHMWW